MNVLNSIVTVLVLLYLLVAGVNVFSDRENRSIYNFVSEIECTV